MPPAQSRAKRLGMGQLASQGTHPREATARAQARERSTEDRPCEFRRGFLLSRSGRTPAVHDFLPTAIHGSPGRMPLRQTGVEL